ncbi:hypothetical protein BH11BAC4_BH11BAC4_08670 [soil metagenome]
MNIQLIKGQFNAKDAIKLITEMIHVKIRFHESQIHDTSIEEDIKMREHRIKQLQKDLYNARNYIEQQAGTIAIESEISLSK